METNAIGVQSNKSVETRLSKQYSQLMNMLYRQSIVTKVQEVSHTSNSAQLTGNTLVFNNSSWIIDSGATDHMCHQLCLFDSMKFLDNNLHTVVVPNGRKITVKYNGNITLPNGIFLREILFVPEFHFNLIYIQKLASHLKCNVTFNTNNCFIQEQLKKPLLLGDNIKGLYYRHASNPIGYKAHKSVLNCTALHASTEEAKLRQMTWTPTIQQAQDPFS